jgi:hypothetical protein
MSAVNLDQAFFDKSEIDFQEDQAERFTSDLGGAMGRKAIGAR